MGYLFKAMGKRVVTNDFLKFAHDLATATIANDGATLSDAQVADLGGRVAGTSFPRL